MYIAMDMKARKYDMGARAQAKTATRDAIIKAAIDAFMAERSFAITLPAVAARADVTVKTVLRHFGSRETLIDAAWSQAYDEVMAERTPPPGDPDAALKVVIAHYERMGEVVLAMLCNENDPRAARMNDTGRLAHREWVEEVFADRLPEASRPSVPPDRRPRRRYRRLLLETSAARPWVVCRRRPRPDAADDRCRVGQCPNA